MAGASAVHAEQYPRRAPQPREMDGRFDLSHGVNLPFPDHFIFGCQFDKDITGKPAGLSPWIGQRPTGHDQRVAVG